MKRTFFVLALTLFPVAESAAEPAPRDVWFDDLEGTLELDDASAEALLRAAAQALATGGEVAGLPPRLLEDRSPRVVFLAASDGRKSARTVIGTGSGLRAALDRAVGRLRARGVDAAGARWLRLEVVKSAGRKMPTGLGRLGIPGAKRRVKFDRSLEGLAFPRLLQLAFLPEELVSHTVVDSDGRVSKANIVHALERRGDVPDEELAELAAAPIPVRTFATQGFFLEDGSRFVSLFRGHTISTDPSAAELLEAVRSGGSYLRDAVTSSGKFAYIYLPKQDTVPDDYNMVRHAGTVYAMMEVYALTRDEQLLAATRRAIGYMLGYVKDFAVGDMSMAILAEKTIKLGGIALAVVALAKYTEATGDRSHLPVMRKLARYIRYSQRESGEFLCERYYPGMEERDFVSRFYPGEALLGLMRLHAVDPSDEWVDCAEKGARWLITVRDAGMETLKLTQDHWLLYALNEIYRARRDDLFLEQAMRISLAMTSSQRTSGPPDYVGSYRSPNSCSTATRTEGLLAAYALARDFGRDEDAARILEGVKLGARFQLGTQLRPEQVMFLDNPRRALGGFHDSMTDYTIRIDFVQHNLSSLLGYYKVLSQQQE